MFSPNLPSRNDSVVAFIHPIPPPCIRHAAQILSPALYPPRRENTREIIFSTMPVNRTNNTLHTQIAGAHQHEAGALVRQGLTAADLDPPTQSHSTPKPHDSSLPSPRKKKKKREKRQRRFYARSARKAEGGKEHQQNEKEQTKIRRAAGSVHEGGKTSRGSLRQGIKSGTKKETATKTTTTTWRYSGEKTLPRKGLGHRFQLVVFVSKSRSRWHAGNCIKKRKKDTKNQPGGQPDQTWRSPCLTNVAPYSSQKYRVWA